MGNPASRRSFRFQEGVRDGERYLTVSSEAREDRTMPPATGVEGRAAATPPGPAAPDAPPFFAALPAGWAVIGRCRFGTGGPGPRATGCYALANPRIGIALIDIAPNATPNAEARLRRALTAAEFWPDFPGTLPVLHDRVDATALRSLPWKLEQGFTALPALTLPGGTAWIEGVRRAMAADPAWEVPGQSDAARETPSAGNADAAGVRPTRPARSPSSSARPRRWGRVALLPLAFAATFALGLVSGFLLLDSPAPVAQPAVVAALPAPPAAPVPPRTAALPEPPAASVPPRTAALPDPPAAPVPPRNAAPVPAPAATPSEAQPGAGETAALTAGAAPDAPSPLPAAPAVVPPLTAEAPAAPVPSMAAPVPRPAPLAEGVSTTPAPVEGAPSAAIQHAQPIQQAAGGPTGIPAAASSALETPASLAAPIDEVLPMAPPRAPAPPVRASAQQQRQASRPAPVIDRACSQALFRFQQGERLTWAEQSFVRSGCSTARR
jgi:hypothetical protein